MTTMMFLLMASMLPSAVGAQTVREPAVGAQAQGDDLDNDPAFKRLSPEQQAWVTATMGRLHAAILRKDVDAIEQVRLDITKHQLLGMTFCGHRVDDATLVDADSSNASREYAIAMRWFESGSAVAHGAIFTGAGRCVVKDGDMLEGKSIARVMANSLAVSNQHALTAWEGEYWNSPGEQATGSPAHRGLFIENRFVAELDPHKASLPGSRDDRDRDFQWRDDVERLTLKPGVFLVPAPVRETPQAAAVTPCAPPAQHPGIAGTLKNQLKRALENQAAKVDPQLTKGTQSSGDSKTQDPARHCAPAVKGQGPTNQ